MEVRACLFACLEPPARGLAKVGAASAAHAAAAHQSCAPAAPRQQRMQPLPAPASGTPRRAPGASRAAPAPRRRAAPPWPATRRARPRRPRARPPMPRPRWPTCRPRAAWPASPRPCTPMPAARHAAVSHPHHRTSSLTCPDLQREKDRVSTTDAPGSWGGAACILCAAVRVDSDPCCILNTLVCCLQAHACLQLAVPQVSSWHPVPEQNLGQGGRTWCTTGRGARPGGARARRDGGGEAAARQPAL